MPTTEIHKEYAHGIGHAERRGDGWLVSFYGRRVAQTTVQGTATDARRALSALAKGAR